MQSLPPSTPDSTETPPSAGQHPKLRVWAVSEPKAGTLTQCLGVGQFFDPEPVQKIVMQVHGIEKLFAKSLFKRGESAPDLIVSCGYRPERHVMKMRRSYGGRPLAVHLQHPRIDEFDLCFISRHDWKPDYDHRPEYHAVVGVPHRVTQALLSSRRGAARKRYAPGDEKVAAVFVGGANGAYDYDDATLADIANHIRTLAEQQWRVLVSTSRRSSQKTLQALLALRGNNVQVWDRNGDNPYLDYVAAADAFLIAKDSITMPCEALVTGRPVYALDLAHIPGGRIQKFEGFHRDLQEVLGLTRPFRGELSSYPYTPLDETARIAGVIAETLAKRAAVAA